MFSPLTPGDILGTAFVIRSSEISLISISSRSRSSLTQSVTRDEYYRRGNKHER
jgi:hypothetical protein